MIGFAMASCGNNKKDAAIAMFNQFFDSEEALLNEVNDIDAMMDYMDADDTRFMDFYAKLDEKFPLNEDGDLMELTKEESDAAMQVYEDRIDAYSTAKMEKCSAFFEPYLAEAEEAYHHMFELFDEGNEAGFTEAAQVFEEKFDVAERYADLTDDEQFERFYEMYNFVYGDDVEEEEE